MKTCMQVILLTVLGVFLIGRAMAAENWITNPGFEDGSSTTSITGWERGGYVYRENWAYQSGFYGMGFWGWVSGGGVFWQDIDCGSDIQLYYRIMTKLESGFPNHYFYQIITFYNASSEVTGSHTNFIYINSTNRDRWMTNACNYISPGNTVKARVEIRMPDKPSAGSGAVMIDNVMLLPYTNTYRYGVTAESFVYDDSQNHPLNGENWGHGWSNAWTSSSSRVFVEPNNLGTVTNYPVYAGAKLGMLPQNGSSEYATRGFCPIDRGKIYCAYEMVYNAQSSGDWCGAFMTDNGTNKFFWGEIAADYNRLGITTYPGASNQVAAGTADYGNGSEYVVIACYDFETRELKFCRYYIDMGNIPLQEPAVWDASMPLAPGQITSLNGIKVSAGGSSGTPSPCYFDEIRIATNWWDLLKISPMDPVAHASNMVFNASSDNSLSLSWQRGNGEGVLVVMREAASPVNPSDGSTYSASSIFGNGSNLGSSSYVVYNGSGTNVTVTGLSADTLYYVSVFEYNGQSSQRNYNTSGEPLASEYTSGQPEITLVGLNSNEISDGDTTPQENDGTDFGPFLVGSTTSHTFTIENDGVQNLTISGITRSGNTADYSVSEPVSSIVAPGGSTTFSVTYTPVSAGTTPATITINNNDSNEGVYTFTVQADAMTNFLSYSTGNLSFELYRGTVDPSTLVYVYNNGFTNISYTNTITYHSSSNWLYVSPTSSSITPTGTGSVNISPRARLVEPGSYTATMTALSGNNNGAPQVDLSITINEIPTPQSTQLTQPAYTTNVLTWQVPSGFTDILILHRENAAVATAPAQNTFYGNGASIGSATVVYKGSGTSFTHTVDAGSADNYALYTINNNHYSPAATLVSTPAAEAEILLHGMNSNTIYDGDTTPSASDGTDFGTFLVGSTTSRTFTIYNTGQQNLIISNITLSGNISDYSISGPASSAISAGGSTTFQITCAPQSENSTPATVSIRNNDSDEGIFTFQIETEAVSNHLAIASAPMSFELYRGSQGSDHWIYITNRAPYSIFYTNTVVYNSSSNWIWPESNSGGLGAQGHTIATIRPRADVAGTGVGSFTAKLLVKSGNPNGDIERDISISINEIPTPQNVSLSQPGYTTNILSWQIPSGFSSVLILHRENAAIDTAPTHGTSYSIGSSIGSATVVYRGSGTSFTQPVDAATADNYALYTINNNHYSPAVTRSGSAAGEAEIALRGLNSNQIYDGDTVPSQSDGTDFSSVLIGSTTSQVFTIQNTGEQDLVISNISVSGSATGYSIQNQSTNRIISGASATFDVCYTPASAGMSTATVRIANSDSDENLFTFAVQAKAVSRYLSFSTNAIHFEFYRDQSDSTYILLSNDAPYTVYYTNRITYQNGSGWLWAAPTNGTISAGPTTRNVSFSPIASTLEPGSYTATVSLASSIPGETDSVAVTFDYVELPSPLNPQVSRIGNTTNVITWQHADGLTNVLVLYSEDEPADTLPNQLYSYSVGNTIGNAVVVYKGSATALTHTVSSTVDDHYALFTIMNNRAYSPATNVSVTAAISDPNPPRLGPASTDLPTTPNNLLFDPGFEYGFFTLFGWTGGSTGGGIGVQSWFPRSGNYHGWVGTAGKAWIGQAVDTYAGGGITWQASAWMSRESALTSDRYLALKFYNSSNEVIHAVTNHYGLPGRHEYTNVTVTATSPEGTEFAVIYSFVDGTNASGVLMTMDDAVLQAPRPLQLRIGEQSADATGTHTNSIFALTDGDMAAVNTENPLYVTFGAYDLENGLSRGTTDPSLQMNISINNWITNNVANYSATDSSSFADTYSAGATSTWKFTSIPAALYNQTNLISATVYDNAGTPMSLANQPFGYLAFTDDDTTPPAISSLAIFGAEGSNKVLRVSDLQNGSWTISGTVSDADSGININGTQTSQPNCSPYFELHAPNGLIVQTSVFNQYSFSDGEATTPEGISRSSHTAIANPVSGVWTAYVYAADNDIDRAGDQLVTVTTIVFQVIDSANMAPYINLPGPHILPVGSTTNFTVDGDDPDDHSFSLFNTQAPDGASYVGWTFSWTATPAYGGTTNLLVFVINDSDGAANSIITNSTTITVPYDYDEDSLADSWEWNNFSTLSYGPTDDPDHDGADNRHEFIAGTSPDSAGDVFTIGNKVLNTVSGTLTLSISAQPGKTYTIEYSDQTPQSGMTWQTFSQNGNYTENGSGSHHSFIDTFNSSSSGSSPSGGRRYYRIKVQDD